MRICHALAGAGIGSPIHATPGPRRSAERWASTGRVARLQRGIVSRADQLVEHVVDPVEDHVARAAVRPERLDQAALRAHRRLLGRVDGHVGASEAVDRLLGVAHQEEAARLEPLALRVAGERRRDRGLPGVGVLELVDQQRVVARPQCRSRRGRVAQQVARPEDEVVEHQRPLAATRRGLVEHHARDGRQQPGQRVGSRLAEQLAERRARTRGRVARLVQGHAVAAPVRQVAEPRALPAVQVGGARQHALALQPVHGAQRLERRAELDQQQRAGVVARGAVEGHRRHRRPQPRQGAPVGRRAARAGTPPRRRRCRRAPAGAAPGPAGRRSAGRGRAPGRPPVLPRPRGPCPRAPRASAPRSADPPPGRRAP